jgi:hypothetical protein
VMRAAERKFEGLNKQTAALDKAATPLVTAINQRGFWVQLVDDLNTRLPPEDIWITELIPLSAGKPVGVDDKHTAEAAANPTATAPARKASGSAPAIDAVLVRGLYMFNPKQEQLVVDFFRKLVGSPYFAVNPADQSRVIKSTIPTNTEWAFPYELHLELRNPLSLP